MTTLLHVDASARTSRSLSRGLSGRFVSDWMARRPSDNVIVRDVGRYPPPITTELWIGSVFTPEAEITGVPSWSGFEASNGGDRVYIKYRRDDEVVSMVERAGYRIDFTEVIASPANASKPTQDLILIAQRQRHAW